MDFVRGVIDTQRIQLDVERACACVTEDIRLAILARLSPSQQGTSSNSSSLELPAAAKLWKNFAPDTASFLAFDVMAQHIEQLLVEYIIENDALRRVQQEASLNAPTIEMYEKEVWT